MSADWVVIERDFRAGVLSVREIAGTQSISHTAINKRAKTEGWTRDLGPKIRARSDALVARKEAIKAYPESSGNAVTEREVVESNAEAIARVRMVHRTDIGQARELATQLRNELRAVTNASDVLDDLFELVHPEPVNDSKGAEERHRKLREAFERAVSLAGRVKTMKDLGDTLKTLVTLEREAYGLATAETLPPAADQYDPVDIARRMAFVFAEAKHTLQ